MEVARVEVGSIIPRSVGPGMVECDAVIMITDTSGLTKTVPGFVSIEMFALMALGASYSEV